MKYSDFKEPIFYVTPDPTRAIGLEKILPNYHVVCLDNNFLVDLLLKEKVNVFSLEKSTGKKEEIIRNTGNLLEHPLVQEYIKEKSNGETPNILFFKPSKKIEAIAKTCGYNLIGNSSDLNSLFEDKISFYQLAQSWGIPVPCGEIEYLKNCKWIDLSANYGSRMVMQFGHGWAGNTTYFINSEDEFKILQNKFGSREVRITKYIDGLTYLVNACISNENVLVSLPAVQITAPEGFTKNPGGTCGRQWPAVDLSKEAKNKIYEITKAVGKRMGETGYRGFFGLDFLVDSENDEVLLSENNARLTASVPFYTKLELVAEKVPLLLHHIQSFLNKEQIDSIYDPAGISGSELIIRNDQQFEVKVNENFLPGIYRYGNNKLERVSDGYSVENCRAGEFFLVAVGLDRVVTEENEIARLDVFDPIFDNNSGVKECAKNTLLTVKEYLRLSSL